VIALPFSVPYCESRATNYFIASITVSEQPPFGSTFNAWSYTTNTPLDALTSSEHR